MAINRYAIILFTLGSRLEFWTLLCKNHKIPVETKKINELNSTLSYNIISPFNYFRKFIIFVIIAYQK